MTMTAMTEAIVLTGFGIDQASAITELNAMLDAIARGDPVVTVPTFPGYVGPITITTGEQAESLWAAVRRMITNGGVSGSTLSTNVLAQFAANPAAPPSATLTDFDVYLTQPVYNAGVPPLSVGDVLAAFSGVPSITTYGSGNPPATGTEFGLITGELGAVSDDMPGMSGLTTYNRVEGHFFLKSLPEPKLESVTRTVQGLADRFESQFTDPGVGSMLKPNERVRVTETVFQGEMLSVQTQSRVATYTASGVEKHAIVAQGGDSFNDTTYGNVASSSQDTMVALAVEDIRLFALKGLDTDEEALFDLVNPTKPTNENYVRHLTPESETRVAVLETPQALRDAGGPPKILIHYDAIDLTGEVVAGWKGKSWFTAADHAQTYRNDMDAITTMSKKGWLVVKRTVPDTNAVFVDTSAGYPIYRSVLDWLRRPYTASQFSSPPSWNPMTIHAPGGLITIPAKELHGERHSHWMRANPTGDLTGSPFVNVEDCAHTVIQGAIAGSRRRNDAYGPPRALPNTRSPVEKSESAYHTLSIRAFAGEDVSGGSSTLSTLQPVNLEQFDIIDNLIEADRHLLLIHPSNRERAKTLSTLRTKQDSPTNYHECSIELSLMRARVEEIAPSSGEMQGGVVLRGRSQLLDINDRLSERDFDLNEGHPLKEIGDLGTPTVSVTLGGLGQGGIDVAADRTEHSFLPVWKDRVVGTGNPSVRNDRQTSTYYASTRALVELPLFPSTFFDIEQRLPSSTNKRSPNPSDRSMEFVVDCTMTATNRPQMGRYENRWSIDWGLRDGVSALRIHDYAAVVGKTRVRFMRDNAATFATGVSSGTTFNTTYIEVDSINPFINEGGFDAPAESSGVRTFAAAADHTGAFTPSSEAFVVTVGEGILSDGGIRLHVYKTEISGSSHRLYFDAFHDWSDENASLAAVKTAITYGMPVVMGAWLSDTQEDGNVWPLSELNVSAGTSNATMAQNFVDPMRYTMAFGRMADSKTAISIDPDDDATLLIRNGPTMEGFVFDPANHLFSDDDFPLQAPVECRTGYLSLKGKRSDGTLDYVRPLRLNAGDIASSGNVSNFNEAVQEFIRRINQAGHPNASNTAGGSAFDPPQLFTTSDGTETVSSSDTGSHMGYVRAFLGGEVESRDGESGLSVVIHSTVPGATGRNFAVWMHNHSLYPYRPVQAVGHGGLLATNSRSYQASSFPAPLPIGMDGETHIPITTFQGGVHGRVQDDAGGLRTYAGIGGQTVLKTVRGARRFNNIAWPNYDSRAFPHLAVERSVMDLITRMGRRITEESPGYILVNDSLFGTFTDIGGGIGATDCMTDGPGACAFLLNVQPLEKGVAKQWTEQFVNNEGESVEASVRILYPLPDAHGILFFGGGHTGTVFDISDGTANDYSDFYTHHYSQGPSGYAGFQNLEEVQTSAAVLDFTQVRNRDTVKENTYRGLHGVMTVPISDVSPTLAFIPSRSCIFYMRLNESAINNVALGAGKELVLETLHDRKALARGTFASTMSSPVPMSDDPESAGVDFAASTDAGIALHTIQSEGGQIARLLVPGVDDAQGTLLSSTTGNYTISFFFSAEPNVGPWVSQGYGNGPVIHGIDHNGAGYGISIETKEGTNPAVMDIAIIARVKTSAGEQDERLTLVDQPKNGWYHVIYARSAGSGGALYVNGALVPATPLVPAANTDLVDQGSYNAGTIANTPHLPQGVGVGTLSASGVLVNKSGGYTAGSTSSIVVDTVAASSHFSVGDHIFTNAGVLLGEVLSLTDTNITLTRPILAALANNEDLKKSGALSSGFYGRDVNMLTVGMALHTVTPTAGFYYGKHHGGASNAYDPIYFNGALSEIAMWDHTFDATEAANLYNARTVWN